MKPFASPLCVVKIIKHEKKPAFMRAGYFWWLQQKRCNELLHLWGMILPLCHRSFQFSPALAGVLLYKMNVATFQFSFLREERSPRKDMITQGNSYFNSRPLRGERAKMPICHPSCHYFNSRSLREERYITGQSNKDIIVISILALSVGSDLCAYTTH